MHNNTSCRFEIFTRCHALQPQINKMASQTVVVAAATYAGSALAAKAARASYDLLQRASGGVREN